MIVIVKIRKLTLALFSLFFILASCSDNDDSLSFDEPVEINDSFEEGMDGWSGDFADYGVDREEDFDLEFERTDLPEALDTDQNALKLSGMNGSDDLFMFLKKSVPGLKPDTPYNIEFTIEFASNVADGLVGIGGSPGESVFVKAGASTIEPEKVVVTDPYEMYRMNIDKGVQSNGGENAVVIGDFSNDTDQSVYTLKTVTTSSPFQITTDESGELWLLVGTDSGFEGTTTIYYNQIRAEITANDEIGANN